MYDAIALPEWQIQEVAKCTKSPEHFISTFAWLQQKASAGVSKVSSTIPFEMGETEGVPHFFQRTILRWLHSRENVVAWKSRRVGCSWIAAAYVAWLVNFHEDVSVLFISQTGLKAKKILEKVKFILNNLALHDNKNLKKATSCSWLRSEIYTDNQEQLSICWRNDDGTISSFSEVISLTNTDDSGRGDDATFIVFDELGFYEHPEETWASAKKATTLGGHWFAISTSNEVGDVFHRLVAKGELAANGQLNETLNYKYTGFIHWRDAGITEEQVERASEGDTQDKKDQEWEGKFIAPGTVAFDPTHLAACYKPLSEYPEIAAELERYRRKVAVGDGDFMYYGGADTSVAKTYRRRTQKDYHSVTFLTAHGIQADAYHSKESLAKWAGKVIDDGSGQRVEIKGTLSKKHQEYPGILYAEEEGPGYTSINQHEVPDDTFSELVPTAMKHQIKRGAVERLILKVEHHQVIITDYFTYQCMSVFQSLGSGQYGAPEGYWDDPVTAMVLACAALDAHGMMEQPWGTNVAQIKRSPLYEGDILEPTLPGSLLATDIPVPEWATRQSELVLSQMSRLPANANDDLVLSRLAQESERDFQKLKGGKNAF